MFPLQVRVPIVEVMICVRRSATREEHRHDRGVGGSDLVCAFPQHFAVEAILSHLSSVAECCRRAMRTRTIFFSSFVPNSIRLPFKGSVEFGRSLSRVEVGNGLVEHRVLSQNSVNNNSGNKIQTLGRFDAPNLLAPNSMNIKLYEYQTL